MSQGRTAEETQAPQRPLCQVCGNQIPAEESVRCERCGTPHHRDCWAYNQGCSTYGCHCNAAVRAPAAPAPTTATTPAAEGVLVIRENQAPPHADTQRHRRLQRRAATWRRRCLGWPGWFLDEAEDLLRCTRSRFEALGSGREPADSLVLLALDLVALLCLPALLVVGFTIWVVARLVCRAVAYGLGGPAPVRELESSRHGRRGRRPRRLSG